MLSFLLSLACWLIGFVLSALLPYYVRTFTFHPDQEMTKYDLADGVPWAIASVIIYVLISIYVVFFR